MFTKSLIFTAVVAAAPLAALAAPVSSTIQVAPTAVESGGAFVPVIDSDSQAAALGPLSAGATASQIGFSVSASMSAAFASASSGQVTIANGWTADPGVSGSMNFNQTIFEYVFVATGSGLFEVDYVTTLTGNDTFGANQYNLEFGETGGPTQFGQAALNGSGTEDFTVISGEEYRFAIRLTSNISGGIGGRTMSQTGVFDWSGPMAVVPLPAGGPLLAGALAVASGLGFARRRAA